jgi:hypothetical protein
MKARQKRRLAGSTTGCCANKEPCIEEKQRVRQPAVRYTQKNKKKKNKYIHTQTHRHACWYACLYEERELKQKQTSICVSLYVFEYEERERISVTLVTTAAQGV